MHKCAENIALASTHKYEFCLKKLSYPPLVTCTKGHLFERVVCIKDICPHPKQSDCKFSTRTKELSEDTRQDCTAEQDWNEIIYDKQLLEPFLESEGNIRSMTISLHQVSTGGVQMVLKMVRKWWGQWFEESWNHSNKSCLQLPTRSLWIQILQCSKGPPA